MKEIRHTMISPLMLRRFASGERFRRSYSSVGIFFLDCAAGVPDGRGFALPPAPTLRMARLS
jgi:hypothetical protein